MGQAKIVVVSPLPQSSTSLTSSWRRLHAQKAHIWAHGAGLSSYFVLGSDRKLIAVRPDADHEIVAITVNAE